MLSGLPNYVYIMFGTAVAMSCLLLVYASGKNKGWVGLVLLAWLGIQTAMGLAGFYQNVEAVPPRFIFLILPALLAMVAVFATNKRHGYLDVVDIHWLSWIHVVRIPVEIVLFWLFKEGQVPELMTFTGYNYDIVAGITAPIAILAGFNKGKVTRVNVLLWWNVLALILLANIVITAVLSAEVPFQLLAFDQPNRAVTFFPFNLLPSLIVPIVLFAHLASILKLWGMRKGR